MIEKVLYKYLRDSPKVVAAIGENLFTLRSPAGTSGSRVIMVRVDESHEFHLQNEAACEFASVEFRTYGRTQTEVESIQWTFKDRLSGAGPIDVTWLNEGRLQTTRIFYALIRAGSQDSPTPRDASDADSEFWHIGRRIYEVGYSQLVPTHT